MDRLSGWNPKIAELFDRGQRFLGCRYSEPGWLYRGASSGLTAILKNGRLDHFDGEQSVTRLEIELGIYLVSQDFSDAYSVARLWEGNRDGYIAVFKSRIFNRELEAGRAAVLGFAEPGVVFKYPLLIHPLRLSEVDFLIVPPHPLNDLGPGDGIEVPISGPDRLKSESPRITPHQSAPRLIRPAIDPQNAGHRSAFEKALFRLLNEHGIKSAVAMPASNYPKAG